MNETMRWALLGASDIASSRMLPAIRAAGSEAVVVRSDDEQRAVDFATNNDIASFTTSVDDAVNRADVDVVYVGSRNQDHPAQVIAASRAGKPVLAEKPLALTLDEAKAMVGACESAGVVMATNHHLPASPVHQKMKELVADGEIGNVLAVHVNHAVGLPAHLRGWRVDDPVAGGVVLDVFIHDMAAVAAIIGGQAQEVSAMARSTHETTAPDSVMTTVRWTDDVIVQTHDAYDNYDLPSGLDILGNAGAIRSTASMTGDPIGDVTVYHGHEATPIDIPNRRDLYLTAVEAFENAVRTGVSPLVTAHDGLRSLAAALAAQQSLRSGSTVSVEPIPIPARGS
ncbi:MAG: Gfo/Idh/MocA family protein [Acidimicrobiales bacterium]